MEICRVQFFRRAPTTAISRSIGLLFLFVSFSISFADDSYRAEFGYGTSGFDPVFNGAYMGPLSSLESRYPGDKAKEVALCTDSDSVDDKILPWNERQTWLSHIAASILTLSFFGLIAYERLLHRPVHHAVLVLLFLFYLAEAAFCSTRRYLSNMQSPAEIMAYVKGLTEAAPVIRWHLECYHYRRGSRSESDKIVTYRASRNLIYDQ